MSFPLVWHRASIEGKWVRRCGPLTANVRANMIKVEDAAKYIETASKYSWAVFIGIAFVLFAPREAADQIGITEIRKSYLGYLWVGLVVSASIWAVAAFKYADTKLEGHLSRRREQREKENKAAAKRALLLQRLNGLSPEERMWIKYCLFYGQQTLSAERTRPFVQALVYKGILQEGSGHILNLPFHVRDDVWAYLCENKAEFLTDEESSDPRFLRALEKFHESLHPSY